jgi:hypothetical protein
MTRKPSKGTAMTSRQREMVIDYWSRVFCGESDPHGAVARKFRLTKQEAFMFFITLQIFEMSETRH